MKDFTAKLLILCFVLNSFLSFNAINVEAASVNLIADMEKRLIENPASLTPIEIKQSAPENQTFLSFNVEEGEYTLSYITEEVINSVKTPKEVRVTVKKDLGGIYDVNYNVYKSSGTGFTVPHEVVNTYNIYAFNRTGSRGYTSQAAFLANYNNNGNIAEQKAISGNSPHFNVGANRGYSFQYDNATVHFKIDANGNFLLATDSTKLGSIYDFKLSNDTTSVTKTVTVNTGLDLQISKDVTLNETVTPTANNGLTISTILDITPPVSDTNPDNKRLPGSNDVGLIFKIPLPKKWDGTTFSQTSASPVPVLLRLGYDIQIPIDDIYNPPATLTINPATVGTGTSQITTDALNNKFLTVNLKGLPANRIYNGTLIRINESGSSQKTRGSLFPNSTVFTFVQYEIVPKGGKYYAKVKPYKSHDGKPVDGYFLLSDSSGSVLQRSDGINDTMIPLNVSPENLNSAQYQVFFSPGNDSVADNRDSAIYSQKAIYKADKVDTVSTPLSFNVSREEGDIILKPTSKDLKQSDLTMTVSTDIGNSAVVRSLINAADPQPFEVAYNLQYAHNMKPDNKPPFVSFAFLKVSLRKNPADPTKYQIKYSNYSYKEPALDYVKLEPPLPQDDPSGIVLATDWQDLKMPSPSDVEALVMAENIKIVTPANKGPQYSPNVQFYYPNIYFLNAKPVLQTDLATATKTLTKKLNASPSLSKSLTLSDISQNKPPEPQSLDLVFGDVTSPKDETSFHADWSLPGKGVKEFYNKSYGFHEVNSDLRNMLQTIRTTASVLDTSTKYFVGYDTENADIMPKGSMTLYISQDSSYMVDKFPKGSNKFSDSNASRKVAKIENVAKYKLAPTTTSPGAHVMTFSTDDADNAVNLVGNGTSENPRDALRNGKVVAIEIDLTVDEIKKLLNGQSIAFDYLLEGLDRNQKYYAFSDLYFESTTDSRIWYESNVSNLATITTKGKTEIPSPGDKVPQAPKNLSKKDVGLDTATIFWDKVPLDSDDDPANVKIEYEIVRLKDNQFGANSPFVLNRQPFSEIMASSLWTNIKDEKIALRTKDGKPVNLSGITDLSKYVLDDKDASKYFLKDNDLKPNGLYFYYVRTVKIINGEEKYSVWSAVSVTTTTVKAPKNLKAETNRKDYEPKTEIWISFDAPIPVENKDKIGTDYTFEYQIKPDGEDWQKAVSMDATKLKETATATKEKDYTNLKYKITGLKSGKSYMVRVAMKDVKTDDTSLYSNIATFKTSVNQEEIDTEQKQTEWTDLFKEQLSDIYKSSYWISKNSGGSTEIIYRPDRMEASFETLKDKNFPLFETKEGHASYFIPASSYDKANKLNVGFVVNHGNTQVVIPPGAINLNDNSAAFSIKDLIKTNKAQGYFIKITMDYLKAPKEVEGEPTISDVVQVRFELVSSKQNIGDWDDETLAKVIQKVDEMTTDKNYKDEITKKIQAKATNEEVSIYINNLINSGGTKSHETVKSSLSSTLDRAVEITELDKPINIAIKQLEEASSVNGYRKEGNDWTIYEVSNFGKGKAISTKLSGAYVLTGLIVNIPNIEKVEKGGTALEIVSKYGLAEFLGKEKIDLKENASREMVINSVARMMGAPKGIDSVDYLKNEGKILVSSRGQSNDATIQESVYLVMNLYAKKTNTNLNAVTIRNQKAFSNPAGIEEKYLQSLKVAYELNIYKENRRDPNSKVTIEELLKMLTEIDKKKKL